MHLFPNKNSTVAKSQASFRIYIYPQKLKIMNVHWSSKNIKQNHGVSFPIKTSTTAKLFQFPLQYRCAQNLEGQLCATKSEPLTTFQKVKLAWLFVTERTSRGVNVKQIMGFPFQSRHQLLQNLPVSFTISIHPKSRGTAMCPQIGASFQYSKVKFRYYLSCDYV